MMNFFRYIWRVYVLFVILLTLVILSPILYIMTFSDKTYSFFYFLARVWGTSITMFSGWFFRVKKEDKIDYSKKYVIVANHSSYLDIFSIYTIFPKPVVFMGKEELAKIPLFSRFYSKTNVLVKRGSAMSAKRAFEKSKKMLSKGRNMCIFPEGGIPKDYSIKLAKFKDGAFTLAKETNTEILPITFLDNKKLFPYSWKKGGVGFPRVYIHKPINPKDYSVEELKEKIYNIILKKLME